MSLSSAHCRLRVTPMLRAPNSEFPPPEAGSAVHLYRRSRNCTLKKTNLKRVGRSIYQIPVGQLITRRPSSRDFGPVSFVTGPLSLTSHARLLDLVRSLCRVRSDRRILVRSPDVRRLRNDLNFKFISFKVCLRGDDGRYRSRS